MQIDLKPCPFCGGAMMLRGALWPSEGDTDAVIHAEPTDCPMYDFCDGTADGSIAEKWNRRALTSATPPDVASLSEALENLLHAVCGETGFAACVRKDSGRAYPWPALDEAEEQAATALRLSAGGGWRSMDSAPHGVNVLLAYWDEALGGWHMEAGMASWGWRRDGVSNMSAHGQATHWQPLPASPTVEAGHVE